MSNLEIRGSSDKKEELLYLFSRFGFLAISLIALSTAAFSREIKKRMLDRDDGHCTECDSDVNLEASHYNHDKNNDDYNNLDNGRILCTRCHLKDHIENKGKNGLTEEANNWAIEKLKGRVAKQETQERKNV